MMLLTVITAVKNAISGGHPEWVERCVRSVATLPFEHEHLIVDGLSTDGTMEALGSLSQQHGGIRIISESDTGIYDALDKGVCLARGQYVLVLGIDDYVVNGDNLSRCLEDAVRRELDLLITPVRSDDTEAFPCDDRAIYTIGVDNDIPYCHQGVLTRTEYLQAAAGYDKSYRLIADYKFHLRSHYAGASADYLDLVFAFYGSEGVSSVSAERVLADEGVRARSEVYGLSDIECERNRVNGALPFRVVWRFLKSGSPFSRAIGRRALWSLIYHKHKYAGVSRYVLFGCTVLRHTHRNR